MAGRKTLSDRLAVEFAARLAARGMPAAVLSGLIRAASYADLDELAEAHGIARSRLMPIWHEVRAAV